MLKKLQRLSSELALVHNSGVQFIDYGFRFDPEVTFTRSFLERVEPRADGAPVATLRLLDVNRDTGEEIDAETREVVTGDAIYSVPLARALAAFDGEWLPAPYFKRKGLEAGQLKFESGPTNWARLRVTALETPDDMGNTHRLTFAFDTRVSEILKGRPYTGPTPEDVRNTTNFNFAPNLIDNSWFLYEPWVKGWLEEVWRRALQDERTRVPRRRDDNEAECGYWAYYSVLLAGLADLNAGSSRGAPAFASIRFLDTLSGLGGQQAIDVDLVLDVGNSRTCGVLIETSIDGGLDLKNAATLELRDISRPHLAYSEPFRSHVEFSRAQFGSDYWSRLSGRSGAFAWPSLVRVGPEAIRLYTQSTGAEGETGLSGPKRYLWDERENAQNWYFNASEGPTREQTPVFSELLQHLTQDGQLLERAGADARPALQPRFARASLFTFMVMELLQQALVQINAPASRAEREDPNVPRRLRRVVFTIPTATPIVERERYQARCEAAAKLLWKAIARGGGGPIPEPEINIAYDEATCTQVVYLYSEIVERQRVAPRDLFRLIGRHDSDGRDLRVASLDIGGGTTDLMIVSYKIDGEGNALSPQQNFREGFRRAGDDILEAVIAQHVLPSLEKALGEAGLRDAHGFLQRFMSNTDRGVPKGAPQRHQRKLFVSRVLVPIGLALLSEYEAAGLEGGDREALTLAHAFPSGQEVPAALVAGFEALAAKDGAQGFRLANVPFDLNLEALGATVAGIMGEIMGVMCEVIHELDCDMVLVTGRPSRLPMIRDLALRFMPTAPHRIVFMHEYSVGSWYPFAGSRGTIEDPKTTVVMGALLAMLAERRRIPDFSLSTLGFNVDTTANYVGRVLGERIRNEDVIFARTNGRFPTESKELIVAQPMFIGFRQLPLERWPPTPLFYLDIPERTSNPTQLAQSMPWKVRFRRKEVDGSAEGAQRKAVTEAFVVDQIVDRDGNPLGAGRIQLRLQTLGKASDYWLDTGIVEPA